LTNNFLCCVCVFCLSSYCVLNIASVSLLSLRFFLTFIFKDTFEFQHTVNAMRSRKTYICSPFFNKNINFNYLILQEAFGTIVRNKARLSFRGSIDAGHPDSSTPLNQSGISGTVCISLNQSGISGTILTSLNQSGISGITI